MSLVRSVCFRLAPVALLLGLTACSVMKPDPHLSAFTTQLTGANEVPHGQHIGELGGWMQF